MKQGGVEIVMLLQEYFPSDVRVWKEATALTKAGYAVKVICLKNENQKSFEEIEGIGVRRVNLTKKRGNKLRYVYEYGAFYYLAKRELSSLLRESVPDIVYVHNLPDFLVFAAAKAKRKGSKIVLDMHEIMPEFYMSKFLIGASHPVIRFLKYVERKSLRYADQVITINNALKRRFELRSRPERDIAIVMNTVSDEVFPRVERQKQEKFIAMYHGTLTKTYNLEFAIRALPPILGALGDFEFHIYGNGTELSNLKNVVQELGLTTCVLFKGTIEYKKVPQAMASASLGIIPLQRDVMLDLSFSNKLAEYVHMGLPVLHSEIPSVVEYFPRHTLSYFKSGDVVDFQNELVDICTNYDQHLQRSKDAGLIYQTMNWEAMKVELIKTVNQLLTDSK